MAKIVRLNLGTKEGRKGKKQVSRKKRMGGERKVRGKDILKCAIFKLQTYLCYIFNLT